MRIDTDTAENVIYILEQVAHGEKARTGWDCNTEYDRQEMMKYRSSLRMAASYLSKFCMPEVFRQEVERIYEKTKNDDYKLPVPKLHPAKHLKKTGESPLRQPETIDTIQANILKDLIKEDEWTVIIVACALQKAGMLRFTNVGEKFSGFWRV